MGMNNKMIKTIKEVIPVIYAYTTPEIARHDGYTKIGDTGRETGKRLVDGLKDTTPFGIPEDFMRKVSLFPKVELEKTSVYCKIKDWDNNIVLEYRTMKG